jgi:hypothetical protein
MGQGFRLIVLMLSFLWLSSTQAFGASTSADALFTKGKSYHDGVGVAQNYDVARALYERAAAAGSTDAQLNLGYLYFVGEGVTRNFVTARKWYERAAKAGDVSAVKNLEFMNAQGLGIAKKRDVKPRKVTKTLPKPRGVKLGMTPENYLLEADTFEARAAKTLGPFYTRSSNFERVTIDAIEEVTVTVPMATAPVQSLATMAATAPTRDQFLARLRNRKSGLSTNTDVAVIGAFIFILTLISLILCSDFYVKNRKRATHKLAVEFFEKNRRTVRDAYFRYSAELREMRYAESKLDTVLSVLIVRYVLRNYGMDELGNKPKQGQLIGKIRTLALKNPAESRYLAGSLAPHILDLIRSDIRALDIEHETASTAPDFYTAPVATRAKPVWNPRIVSAN